MKVAVFTETYHPQVNGVVVFLSDILPLISKKAEVVLFAPGDAELNVEKVNRNFKIYWVPAYPFPFYEGYRMARIRSATIEKILREEKPNIIHLHAPVLMGLRALKVSRKLGIPVIATYHTHFPDYLPHLFKGLLPKPFTEIAKLPLKRLIKYVFSKATCTTAPTLELKKELESYGVKNVLHIPNGTLFEKFGKGNPARFMRRYGIPKDRPIVLYVGRVSFEKRLEVLLYAFKKIRKATLVIVGSGPSLKNYKRIAKELELNNIIFTGHVSTDVLSDAYSAADIFVSPSDSETFGLTFVEAMHFGLPVIGVDRLGAREIIRHGRNGFCVKAGDSDALVEAISTLIAYPSLRKRLGAQAKKDAEGYDIKRVAERFLQLYKKLCRETKP